MTINAAGEALLQTFERVRIINLPARRDRRRETARQLARLGLAVDGERVAFHPASRPTDAGPFTTIGARGCFMSHLDILHTAATDGCASLLILEDDVDFTRDAELRLPTTLARLRQEEWGLFYGGYRNAGPPVRGEELAAVSPTLTIDTSHFVGFSAATIAAAAPYLARMLERAPGDPAGGPMHVDGAYNWLRREHSDLGTWLALPELGIQRPSRTDVHQLGFADRTPLLREMTELARQMARRLRR
ncbi:glycosyltransferase family 25 protein [Sphingomonas bacterium]|uniref:glycosyltransferase family 25 protein n=1 Tax=Sphingomonas bacterium TaxID=1895847 RepID=UPI001574F227|nr:glycosyltransferase family 25 protein [Sphingomonas bacterium]